MVVVFLVVYNLGFLRYHRGVFAVLSACSMVLHITLSGERKHEVRFQGGDLQDVFRLPAFFGKNNSSSANCTKKCLFCRLSIKHLGSWTPKTTYDRCLWGRFRQLSAIFGSYDYQMKGQDYIDESPWPINWKQNMEGILRFLVPLGREGGGMLEG